MDLLKALSGGDLRSIAGVAQVLAWANTPQRFDQLVAMLVHAERLVVMRAADAIEKISAEHPEWLQPHSQIILGLINQHHLPIELKWHLAQLAGRIQWSEEEALQVSQILGYWLLDTGESKITRANALETYFALAQKHSALKAAFQYSMEQLRQQSLPPSLVARLRKLHRFF